MQSTETPEIQSSTRSKEKYIIEISESLHKKIDKIVRVLNKLDNRKHSKQSWVLEAVREKLTSENPEKDEIVSSKHLSLSFDEEIKAKLDDIVEFQRNFRKTYSRKKWILEAIYDKIEREEDKTEDLLEKLKHSIQNVQK